MNGARGETVIRIDGETYRLCLTLGALAEIETALGCKSMRDLQARLGNLSAADLIVVLAALLRGGGASEMAGRIGGVSLSAGDAARAVAEAFQQSLAP